MAKRTMEGIKWQAHGRCMYNDYFIYVQAHKLVQQYWDSNIVLHTAQNIISSTKGIHTNLASVLRIN